MIHGLKKSIKSFDWHYSSDFTFATNEAPNCDTTRPSILMAFQSIYQIRLNQSFMAAPQINVGHSSKQPLKSFIIDQNVLSFGLLNLIVVAKKTHCRVVDHNGTDHAGINMGDASRQTLAFPTVVA